MANLNQIPNKNGTSHDADLVAGSLDFVQHHIKSSYEEGQRETSRNIISNALSKERRVERPKTLAVSQEIALNKQLYSVVESFAKQATIRCELKSDYPIDAETVVHLAEEKKNEEISIQMCYLSYNEHESLEIYKQEEKSEIVERGLGDHSSRPNVSKSAVPYKVDAKRNDQANCYRPKYVTPILPKTSQASYRPESQAAVSSTWSSQMLVTQRLPVMLRGVPNCSDQFYLQVPDSACSSSCSNIHDIPDIQGFFDNPHEADVTISKCGSSGPPHALAVNKALEYSTVNTQSNLRFKQISSNNTQDLSSQTMQANSHQISPSHIMQENLHQNCSSQSMQGNSHPACPSQNMQGNSHPACPRQIKQVSSHPACSSQSMQGTSHTACSSQNMQGTSHPARSSQSMQGTSHPACSSQNMQGTSHPACSSQSMQGTSHPARSSQSMQGTSHPACSSQNMQGTSHPACSSQNMQGNSHPACSSHIMQDNSRQISSSQNMQGSSHLACSNQIMQGSSHPAYPSQIIQGSSHQISSSQFMQDNSHRGCYQNEYHGLIKSSLPHMKTSLTHYPSTTYCPSHYHNSSNETTNVNSHQQHQMNGSNGRESDSAKSAHPSVRTQPSNAWMISSDKPQFNGLNDELVVAQGQAVLHPQKSTQPSCSTRPRVQPKNGNENIGVFFENFYSKLEKRREQNRNKEIQNVRVNSPHMYNSHDTSGQQATNRDVQNLCVNSPHMYNSLDTSGQQVTNRDVQNLRVNSPHTYNSHDTSGQQVTNRDVQNFRVNGPHMYNSHDTSGQQATNRDVQNVRVNSPHVHACNNTSGKQSSVPRDSSRNTLTNSIDTRNEVQNDGYSNGISGMNSNKYYSHAAELKYPVMSSPGGEAADYTKTQKLHKNVTSDSIHISRTESDIFNKAEKSKESVSRPKESFENRRYSSTQSDSSNCDPAKLNYMPTLAETPQKTQKALTSEQPNTDDSRNVFGCFTGEILLIPQAHASKRNVESKKSHPQTVYRKQTVHTCEDRNVHLSDASMISGYSPISEHGARRKTETFDHCHLDDPTINKIRQKQLPKYSQSVTSTCYQPDHEHKNYLKTHSAINPTYLGNTISSICNEGNEIYKEENVRHGPSGVVGHSSPKFQAQQKLNRSPTEAQQKPNRSSTEAQQKLNKSRSGNQPLETQLPVGANVKSGAGNVDKNQKNDFLERSGTDNVLENHTHLPPSRGYQATTLSDHSLAGKVDGHNLRNNFCNSKQQGYDLIYEGPGIPQVVKDLENRETAFFINTQNQQREQINVHTQNQQREQINVHTQNQQREQINVHTQNQQREQINVHTQNQQREQINVHTQNQQREQINVHTQGSEATAFGFNTKQNQLQNGRSQNGQETCKNQTIPLYVNYDAEHCQWLPQDYQNVNLSFEMQSSVSTSTDQRHRLVHGTPNSQGEQELQHISQLKDNQMIVAVVSDQMSLEMSKLPKHSTSLSSSSGVSSSQSDNICFKKPYTNPILSVQENVFQAQTCTSMSQCQSIGGHSDVSMMSDMSVRSSASSTRNMSLEEHNNQHHLSQQKLQPHEDQQYQQLPTEHEYFDQQLHNQSTRHQEIFLKQEQQLQQYYKQHSEENMTHDSNGFHYLNVTENEPLHNFLHDAKDQASTGCYSNNLPASGFHQNKINRNQGSGQHLTYQQPSDLIPPDQGAKTTKHHTDDDMMTSLPEILSYLQGPVSNSNFACFNKTGTQQTHTLNITDKIPGNFGVPIVQDCNEQIFHLQQQTNGSKAFNEEDKNKVLSITSQLEQEEYETIPPLNLEDLLQDKFPL